MRRLVALVGILVLTGAVVASAALLNVDGGVIQSFDVEVSIPTDDLEDEGFVWVCKVVGHPDRPRLKPGINPIRVGVNSPDAEEGFSDAHPSYIVAKNEECVWPIGEDGNSSSQARNADGDDGGRRSATVSTALPESSTTYSDEAPASTRPVTPSSSTVPKDTTTTLPAAPDVTEPEEPSATTEPVEVSTTTTDPDAGNPAAP